MKRIVLILAVGAAFLFACSRAQQDTASEAKQTPQDIDFAAIQRLNQDAAAAGILQSMRDGTPDRQLAFVNVNVVDVEAGEIVPGQTVIVEDGRISWTGNADTAPVIGDALVIDGAGRFLSPGVTDMHVHSEHLGQQVLRLAAGVTSIREMDGFPWLLRMRDSIDAGVAIGPAMYVAGTIIADVPLYGYAVVAATPEEARQVVRNQASCGYSFIKVHNRLAEPLFDAVANEAHNLGLDLVGHVPHDISLFHALQSAKMRTIEHLKGFLLDQTLLPSDENYVPALDGVEIWLTPTLYTRLDRVYGDQAQRLTADPRQRLNPHSRREEWLANIPVEGDDNARLYDRFVATQATVMKRLIPLHPRWLVGTDAAGYAFNVPGFAAHDEMLLMREAGLGDKEIVRAATLEPAAAMRRDDFGRIAVGQRADLILLAANPLEDVGAYASNLGVMARGVWYDPDRLATALDKLAAAYAEPLPSSLDAATVNELVNAAVKAYKAGYVFEDRPLEAAASAIAAAGYRDDADRLRGLISAPADGPCAADTPL